jgi:hypothetical protein
MVSACWFRVRRQEKGMYFSLSERLERLVARVTGPMSFRLILQPTVAVILGIKDGLMDAKAGAPPFVFDLLFHPKDHKRRLSTAFRRLLVPMIVGTVMDAIAQYGQKEAKNEEESG